MIPVTIAELIDKLILLELQLNQCDYENALHESIVMHESLMEIADAYGVNDHEHLQPFVDELINVHKIIIDTANEIRMLERQCNYGNDFVSAVRRLYLSDVRKSDIKKQINTFFNV